MAIALRRPHCLAVRGPIRHGLLLLALLSCSCAELSMRDAADPARANATFRYVGMRQGARSPDYSVIDAKILSAKATER